jgi:hypothetical protein
MMPRRHASYTHHRQHYTLMDTDTRSNAVSNEDTTTLKGELKGCVKHTIVYLVIIPRPHIG